MTYNCLSFCRQRGTKTMSTAQMLEPYPLYVYLYMHMVWRVFIYHSGVQFMHHYSYESECQETMSYVLSTQI